MYKMPLHSMLIIFVEIMKFSLWRGEDFLSFNIFTFKFFYNLCSYHHLWSPHSLSILIVVKWHIAVMLMFELMTTGYLKDTLVMIQ